jgi:hypothetical protein
MQKPPAGRQASFDSAEMTSMMRGICNFLAGTKLGAVAKAGSAAAISSSAARIATTAILVLAIASLRLCVCVCCFLALILASYRRRRRGAVLARPYVVE